MAGAAAGLAVDLVTYPLDTVKTRLQSHSATKSNLYRGVGAMLSGSVPSAALFFTCFDTLRPIIGTIPAAMVGETVACVVRVPVEVVKQRMQVSNNGSVLKEVWRGQGWRGFYVGMGATLGRDLPFAIVQYPLVRYLTDTEGWPIGLSGAFAGAVAALVTHPLDVLKTRRIVLNNQRYRDAITELYSKRLLFSGCAQRVGMFSIGGVVYFGVYGLFMDYLLC